MGFNDFKISKEEIEGIRLGVVIHVDDSENLRRIKIRVKGVFDEPVKKDDIPYAIPMIDGPVPELGALVGVIFRENDIDQPYYFPRTFVDKQYVDRLLNLYKAMVQGKEDSIKKNIAVFNKEFSEPDVGTTPDFKYTKQVEVVPEDKATESGETVDTSSVEKAFLFEVDKELGKEQISKTHPTGTFMDIKPDGSIVIHSKKDEFNIVEGDEKELVEGDNLKRIKGSLHIQVDGVTEIKIGSATFKVNSLGQVELDAPKVQIKGADFTVEGLATAGANTVKGPFNAIPACIFSGAPHISPKSLGN